MVTICLAGNPNAGKSTIFNALTGARQHVGNWPGKTVEKKEGRLWLDGQEIAVVDLPGAYSLSAFSAEEIITRDFLLETHPDAVVAVVDAANLERNLYLVLQLLEMHVPLIIALNMSDVAENRHIHIDRERLSDWLGGLPVISVIGSREIGLDALKEAMVQVTRRRVITAPVYADLGPVVENEITTLRGLIEADAGLKDYPARWLAIKLLEDEGDLPGQLAPALAAAAADARRRIAAETGEDADTLIADARYRFLGRVVGQAVTRADSGGPTFSDRLDRVLAHRRWGVVVFLALMWIVFQFTANVSAPLLDWVDGIIAGPVTRWAAALLGAVGLGGSWVESLVVDGIIAGVGGVLVFVPVLFSLYVALAVLEDSGYMARAALVMDRFMQRLGLHGKSFLPMLVGFGCNVPGIYATRTLENPEDRKITAFLTTFMSCGARLPVYVVFGSAFFGAASGGLVFGLYALGVGVAVLTSLLLTRVVFRSKAALPFVIELPPYRLPNPKTVGLYVWSNTARFIHNAGTVILAASVVIWLLLAIPVGPGQFAGVAPGDSLFGATSRVIAPALAPAGFGQWEAASSLMAGFVAKEVVIASMNQVYTGADETGEPEPPSTLGEDLAGIVTGLGEAVVLTGQEIVNIVPRTLNIIPGLNVPEANFLGQADDAESDSALQSALRAAFTPLAAVAFNVFILLYVPCMATVAAMRQEFGARWMLAQVAYTLVVAWLAAVLVYQGGLLLGLG
ncbi:MAG: ferrous iron transport protein B [Chloroflexi bacterium]|nr:ferrous iron transport protein B [Chloroflexota bacterium]MDL1883709.1 ferrous iron transport protein B [Anaerolineae bacterium CFX8]